MRARVPILIAAALVIALAADYARITEEKRLTRNREVPLMMQKDYTDAVCTIDGQPRSVATSGCGAVCVAMAAAALTGSRETPQTLFQWAYDTGLYFGDGLGHEAMSRLASRCGCTSTSCRGPSQSKAKPSPPCPIDRTPPSRSSH